MKVGYGTLAIKNFSVFLKKHGHVYVPTEPNISQGKYRKLAYFCETCRMHYKYLLQEDKMCMSTLNATRIRILEDLGFEWNAYNGKWNHRYEQLKEYYRVNGDCRVPDKWGDNPQLGYWVRWQRNEKRRRDKSPICVWKNNAIVPRDEWEHRQKLLDSIGFDWDPYDSDWRRSWEQLRDFGKEYGHFSIQCTINLQLQSWAARERRNIQKYQSEISSGLDPMSVNVIGLDDDRIKALQEIGFWDYNFTKPISETDITKSALTLLNNEVWDAHYQELGNFFNKHGHVYVPLESSIGQQEYRKLAYFCRCCRDQYKPQFLRSGKTLRNIVVLNSTRIELLDKLGFDWGWSALDAKWEMRFQQAESYARVHGHCNVPSDGNENSLAAWIRRHNKMYTFRGSKTFREIAHA